MSHKEEFLAQYGDVNNAIKSANSSDDEIKYSGCRNHLLPVENMKKLADDKDDYVAHLALVRNHSTPREIIDNMTNHRDGEVERGAHMHPHVSPELVSDAIMGKNKRRPKWSGTMSALIKSSPHVTKDHLIHVLHSKDHDNDARGAADDRLKEEHKYIEYK